MIDREPIDVEFAEKELTGHVVETDDGKVRVIVEDADPSQLGAFFADLSVRYIYDVSHDDHSIYILVRDTTPREE